MTAAIKVKEDIIDAPYVVRAIRADATKKRVRIVLADGVAVEIPVTALGSPWTEATSGKIVGLRLRMGGSWLWWEDLGEGLVLDELLATTLKLNPAAILARRARGRHASAAKAAAARRNGKKGARPRSVAASKR